MIRIDIKNDGTGTEKVGNYIYRIYTTTETLAEGTLKRHIRSDGWRILLDKLIDDVYRQQTKSRSR